MRTTRRNKETSDSARIREKNALIRTQAASLKLATKTLESTSSLVAYWKDLAEKAGSELARLQARRDQNAHGLDETLALVLNKFRDLAYKKTRLSREEYELYCALRRLPGESGDRARGWAEGAGISSIKESWTRMGDIT